jgi:phosphohistidine phosphatase
MDVILVRHAIALDRDEADGLGMLDRDRPLTTKGRSRMKRGARGLATLAPEVSALLTSPLRRAAETAEILEKRYKPLLHSVTDALLPEADAAELARVLADGGFGSPVLVVGHEPHLSSWVAWCLIGSPDGLLELGKGGACLLRFDGAPGPARGRLLWLLTPAQLRQL